MLAVASNTRIPGYIIAVLAVRPSVDLCIHGSVGELTTEKCSRDDLYHQSSG